MLDHSGAITYTFGVDRDRHDLPAPFERWRGEFRVGQGESFLREALVGGRMLLLSALFSELGHRLLAIHVVRESVGLRFIVSVNGDL